MCDRQWISPGKIRRDFSHKIVRHFKASEVNRSDDSCGEPKTLKRRRIDSGLDVVLWNKIRKWLNCSKKKKNVISVSIIPWIWRTSFSKILYQIAKQDVKLLGQSLRPIPRGWWRSWTQQLSGLQPCFWIFGINGSAYRNIKKSGNHWLLV